MIRKTLYWIFTAIYTIWALVFSVMFLPRSMSIVMLAITLIFWILALIAIYSTIKFGKLADPKYERFNLWVLAIFITLATAAYQRTTGPTYPVDGSAEIGGTTVIYNLPRSHGGEGGPEIVLHPDNPDLKAVIHYKRYNAAESFTLADMTLSGDSLIGTLPHQPPAGKLEYYIELVNPTGGQSVFVPGPQTIVIRFKGDVPLAVLIPHVFMMFFGMLWSNRTGLEAISLKPSTGRHSLYSFVILFIGGMILGPIVQKYAFGAFWTGVPWGFDLTDNKTLIFVVIWAFALWRHRYNPNPRYFVLAAALITFIMYMIPHSMMGSELDYTTGEVKTG